MTSLLVTLNLLGMTVLKNIQLCLCRVLSPANRLLWKSPHVIHGMFNKIWQTGVIVGHIDFMFKEGLCADLTNNFWQSRLSCEIEGWKMGRIRTVYHTLYFLFIYILVCFGKKLQCILSRAFIIHCKPLCRWGEYITWEQLSLLRTLS